MSAGTDPFAGPDHEHVWRLLYFLVLLSSWVGQKAPQLLSALNSSGRRHLRAVGQRHRLACARMLLFEIEQQRAWGMHHILTIRGNASHSDDETGALRGAS
jgi:hypothetical protein